MKKTILLIAAVSVVSLSNSTATAINTTNGMHTTKGVNYTTTLTGSAIGSVIGDIEMWGERTGTNDNPGAMRVDFDQVVKWTVRDPLAGGRFNGTPDDDPNTLVLNGGGSLLGWSDPGNDDITNVMISGNVVTWDFIGSRSPASLGDWMVFGTASSITLSHGNPDPNAPGNGGDWARYNVQIPESGSTLAMLGLVMAGLAGVRRRRA